jgi:hypothetical protein
MTINTDEVGDVIIKAESALHRLVHGANDFFVLAGFSVDLFADLIDQVHFGFSFPPAGFARLQ